MWAKQLRQRLWQWRGLWMTAPGIAGLVLALRFTGSLQLLEWVALDHFFRWRPPEPADPRIVIVAITEADLARYKLPISDRTLAQLIERLKQQQPRLIGLDLYREIPIEPGRQELTRLFETTPNLIGIGKVVSNPYGSAVSPPEALKQRNQVGANDLVLDSDGKLRRGLLSLKDRDGKTTFTLGAKLALLYLKAEGVEPTPVPGQKGLLGLGKAIFRPLQPNDGGYVGVDNGGYQILANFQNPKHRFTSLTLSEVMDGKFSPGQFRDKIVMIGITAESSGDYFYTSYSGDLAGRSAGVEVHAKLASQMILAALEGRPLINVWAEPWEWGWLFIWAGVGAALGWTKKSPRWTAIGVVLAGSGLVGIAYVLFLNGWWVVVVPPILALVGSAIVNKSYILWENLTESYRSLEEYSHTLEQRVEERTLELSEKNTRLSQEVRERERAEQALRESEQQLREQNTVLMDLSRNKALYRGELLAALCQITEAAARTLDIERVSVWLYDDTRSKIVCYDLFEHSKNRHTRGEEITEADNPTYFAALKEEWIILAEDARRDPRTQDFAETYLMPLGITSLLDMPIQMGGQMMGIVCFEHVGSSREWTIEEQNFGGSLADLTSLAIEAHGRQRAERALQKAEEKYRGIFENAVEGIFQITPEGHYLSANPALARIYGYDAPLDMVANRADVTQQRYVEPNRWQEFTHRLQEQGTLNGFESQVYRRDGSTIWISENVRAVQDERGHLLYYEGIVQDITARREAEAALRLEQEKSERLLLNILPRAIADQLKQGQGAIATRFDTVTILFSDIVDFTGTAARLSPTELVNRLNDIFSAFDHLAERYGLEKIKTIGDAYMVVGGLPEPRPDHAAAIAEMALDMQQQISRFRINHQESFRLRIGINTGPVVAGVIGIKKFSYDLWGDAVNIASRMETHGEIGKIQVTEATYQLLRNSYDFEERGTIAVKGKGEMTTYFLTGRKEVSTGSSSIDFS